MKKAGIVTLLGRPNVGKSTLLNNLLGHKVAITSPKPQTTRFPLQAVFEDERGQIVFVDTPGIFARTPDALSKRINLSTEETLGQTTDLILYIIDPSRPRDTEENKTLGIARKSEAPKILVINKSDILKPNFYNEYAFYEDEFEEIIRVSATKHTNLNQLIERIFDYLPEREALVDTSKMVQPGLNLDSKLYIAEIIREKAFLFTRDELPYTIKTTVDEISERTSGTIYIKGRIITMAGRYKKMIIGEKGRKIKEIGMAARKELEVATGKKVFLDLSVEVDPHWQEGA